MIATGQMISQGVVMKYLLPFVIVIAVARILAEILKPARRSWRRKRGKEFARREKSANSIFAGTLIFSLFALWLWVYGGTCGAIIIGAIFVIMIVLAVVVVVILRKRKRGDVQAASSGDQYALKVEDAERKNGNVTVPPLFPHDEASDGKVAFDDDIAFSEGVKGEAMVRDVIKSLPSDRYVVLHDVWLPMDDGGETQIDHVIVSPYGIFIIETKNWKGTIYADEKSRVWTKYNCGQKMCLKNPTHQNFKHIVSIREKFFSAERDFVFGVVAMSSSAEFKYGVPNGVVYYNELGGWIMGHVTSCIKAEQIQEIVSAIQQWSSTVSEDARRRHCGK